MFYPFPFCSLQTPVPYPLFGTQLSGEPYLFDMSYQNPHAVDFDPHSFEDSQNAMLEKFITSGKKWGIGRYLENRASMLADCPQMVAEERFYHTGVDIMVPDNFTLYAPLDAVVFDCGFEEGIGNYGGFVILQHTLSNVVFYSFYGHLSTKHIVTKGDTIRAGTSFAHIGKEKDSGGWFTHVHLQVLTQKAIDEGRAFQGYIAKNNLPLIEEWFPNPYFLFRY